jgi:hypothetical protein
VPNTPATRGELGQLASAIDKLAGSLDQLVRKDVYEEARGRDRHAVAELQQDIRDEREARKELEKRVANRDRLFLVGLALPILNSLILLYITQVVFK